MGYICLFLPKHREIMKESPYWPFLHSYIEGSLPLPEEGKSPSRQNIDVIILRN